MRFSGPLRFPAALTASALALAGCAGVTTAPLGAAADAVLSAPETSARSAPNTHVSIDLARPLTPDALGLIAVLENPDLKAVRAGAEVARAQVFQAGLLPDPTFNLSYDRLLSGPDPYDAMGAQLIYDLVAIRDRGVLLAAARAARDQTRLDIAWQEWQVAGHARLLGARIGGLARQSALLEAARAAAADALDRGLAAAGRGDLKADDISARRLAAADAADRAAQCARDLAAARRELNRLLGLAPAARLDIAADTPDVAAEAPLPDPEALFVRARRARLDLRALEAGYASQEAVVRKAAYDAFPALQLTVNHARDTARNLTLGPAVNFSLPVWNRNAGGIAVAKATRAQLRAEYAARVFATRADIADLSEALIRDRRRRADAASQVGPLDRIARDAEAAAGVGDLSRATAEAARQAALDKAVALAALDQSLAEQTIALELAVGGAPIAPSSERKAP